MELFGKMAKSTSSPDDTIVSPSWQSTPCQSEDEKVAPSPPQSSQDAARPPVRPQAGVSEKDCRAERANQQHNDFKARTKHFFSNEFKGFDFNLGEKKFRYGVQNPNEVADVQSDITNFVKKFLNEDGSVNDHQGYHKALYTARNADTI